MRLDLPDHPVFSDFKDRKLHIDTVLSCPPGSGQTFMMWAATGQGEHLKDTNEYVLDNKALLTIEEPLNPHTTSPVILGDRECQRAAEIAQNDPMYQSDSHLQLVICHGAPILTYSVFDCTIDQIVSIELQHGTTWVTQALARLWLNLNRLYERKPSLILHLLTEINQPLNQLDYTAYVDTMLSFSDVFGHDRLLNTVISWRWYIHALENRAADLRDINAFRAYYTDMMCGALVQEAQGLTSFYQQQWRGKWYDEYLDWFQDKGVPVVRLTYDEFFFDLKRPAGTFMQDINPAEILRHSYQNLEILYDCSVMVTDQVRGYMRNSIDSLRQRLDNAALRHKL